MKIIKNTPFENGAYPSIQNWDGISPPEGYYVWLDGLDTENFYQYNGFVTLNVLRGAVISYTPNEEAWEAWKATLPPEPEPETTDTEILNMLLGMEEE